MRMKKVLSSRELETEKILQKELPEYVIRANMRLADVIQIPADQFKYMSGYHLDFVICNHEAEPVAAVELDDKSHDTEDGKRRDTNKNNWLEQAKIKLIRIREPSEAYNIKKLLDGHASFSEYKNVNQFNEDRFQENVRRYKPSRKKTTSLNNYILGTILLIGFMATAGWILKNTADKALNEIGKNAIQQQQRIQQTYRQQIQLQQQAQLQQHEAKKTIIKFEQVLVKGKSIRECAGAEKILDNNTTTCMHDHYERRPVNVTQ